MIKHFNGRQVVKQAVLIGTGLVVLVVLLLALTVERPAQASSGVEASSVLAPTAETWAPCVPVGVVAYVRRIHVQCQTAISGVSYFALGTSDAPNVARILSVLTTAQVAGRTLSILYDPADLSGAAIGCSNVDCRLILAAGFGQ
jgi:hypothetical protein